MSSAAPSSLDVNLKTPNVRPTKSTEPRSSRKRARATGSTPATRTSMSPRSRPSIASRTAPPTTCQREPGSSSLQRFSRPEIGCPSNICGYDTNRRRKRKTPRSWRGVEDLPAHLGGGLEAVGGADLDRAHHGVFEALRQAEARRGKRDRHGRAAFQLRADHAFDAAALVGPLPRQHAVEHEAEREEVGPSVEAERILELLGRHVERRADGGAGFGQASRAAERRGGHEAEIDEDGARRRQHQVPRLHVAVHESRAVHGLESLERFGGDRDGLADRHGLPFVEPAVEAFAFEQVGHDGVAVGSDGAGVEGAQDPRMTQRHQDPAFALEPLDMRAGAVLRMRERHLHGDEAPLEAVPRLVDPAHRTEIDPVDDLVAVLQDIARAAGQILLVFHFGLLSWNERHRNLPRKTSRVNPLAKRKNLVMLTRPFLLPSPSVTSRSRRRRRVRWRRRDRIRCRGLPCGSPRTIRRTARRPSHRSMRNCSARIGTRCRGRSVLRSTRRRTTWPYERSLKIFNRREAYHHAPAKNKHKRYPHSHPCAVRLLFIYTVNERRTLINTPFYVRAHVQTEGVAGCHPGTRRRPRRHAELPRTGRRHGRVQPGHDP